MFRSQLNPGLRGIVLIAALMLNGGAALAKGVDSADYVMPGCRAFLVTGSNKELGRKPFCVGLIGLISGIAHMSKDICAPDGVTQEQAVRVVVQYIDSRPERMHEDFKKLALEAMKAAWPCKL